MKIRTVLIVLIFILVFTAVGTAPLAARAAGSAPGFQKMTAQPLSSLPGASVRSMETFKGYVYAGIWGIDLTTFVPSGKIFRSGDGAGWEEVLSYSGQGFMDMIVFKGQLYATAWDGKIFRTSSGTAWEAVTDAGSSLYHPGGKGVWNFEVFKDSLYAITMTDFDFAAWAPIGEGVQIYRSEDGMNWELFAGNGVTLPTNLAAAATTVFDGYLYLATRNFSTFTAEIWRTDGVTIESVGEELAGTFNFEGTALVVFNEVLYLRTSSFGGGQLWSSENGADWALAPGAPVTPNDFGGNALLVFRGQLYLFAQDYVSGMQLWRTADGETWEQVDGGFFAGPPLVESTFTNSVTIFRNEVFFGAGAGDVYRMHLPAR